MAEYLVHKSVELGKVKKARRAVLEQPGYLEQNYIALRKYDGCCGIIQVSRAGDCAYMATRSGEIVRSCDHILDDILVKYPEHWGPGVIFVEVWQEGKDFAEISGKFRQHSPAPELTYKAWDTVALHDYERGDSAVPFTQRLRSLHEFLPSGNVAASYNPGTYGDAEALARDLVAKGGYDGLILKDPAGGWQRGSGSGGEAIKVKPSLSFDLRVVGTEPGKGKHAGRIGRLTVSYFGKVLGVGTGLSDAQRGWEPARWRGLIVEVEAMGHSNDGSLREPRLKGVRYDKMIADDE